MRNPSDLSPDEREFARPIADAYPEAISRTVQFEQFGGEIASLIEDGVIEASYRISDEFAERLLVQQEEARLWQRR